MTTYEFLLQFASGHPFLFWCALWLLWGVFAVLQALLFRLPNRLLRTIKVVARGWPPQHIDADGDWRAHEENNSETH